MERLTMRPMAFVTTLQPFLVAWVVAISFFFTLSLVAVLSKNKTWQQVMLIFAGAFPVVMVVVMLITSLFLDIQIMDLEIVYVPPQPH